MPVIPSWFAAPAWLPLIHALLHTLWLGALAAGGLLVALRTVPAARANLRYGLSTAALALVLLTGIAAGVRTPSLASTPGVPRSLHRSNPDWNPASVPGDSASGAATMAPGTGSGQLSSATDYPDTRETAPWVRVAAAFWALGAMIGLVRAARGTLGAKRLRERCCQLLDPVVTALAEELRVHLRIARQVELLVTTELDIPVVMGIVRPAILLPASLLTGVPTDILRAVLAHELAHIRRGDFLVNLAQMIVEALLFFNPFVWWISQQMRLEREACCDQLAARQCHSPASYVEALVAVIERQHAEVAILPAATLLAASGEPGGKGSVLDRVRRLLVPGYLPALRLRWFSLAAVLSLCGLTLAGLWCGAWAAAQALTPQERIAEIIRLKTDYAPAVFEPGKIAVTGSVVTADGTPFDGRADVYALSQPRQNYQSGYSGSARADGTFTLKVERGIIHLAAVAKGHAPSFLGPLDPRKDKLAGIRIALERGFTASIQIVDEAGQPVPGVRVSGHYQGPPSGASFSLATDAAGTAVLAHAADADLSLKADADSYQMDEIDHLRLSADKPYRWTLKKARPVSGTVISAATGQPLAGASIKLAVVQGGATNAQHSPEDAPVLTTTDVQGRFTLNTLRADSRYSLYVEAPGYGGILLNGVRTDGEPLEISLRPELTVRGEVSNLPPSSQDKDETSLEYSQIFTGESGTYSRGHRLKLTPKDRRADFAIGPLYDAPTEIRIGGRTIKLAAADLPKPDLRIDLADPAAGTEPPGKTRDIVFRFNVPKDAPPPMGTIRVQRISTETRRQGTDDAVTETDVPVVNGTAKLTVPVPNRVSCQPTGLIGYTFTSEGVRDVTDGEGPLNLDVTVCSAGAIFGEVLEEDGTPAHGLLISVYVAKPPARLSSFHAPEVKSAAGGKEDVQNRFAAGPLPLGGEYVVMVHRSCQFVPSMPLRLDAATPIRHLRVVMPHGETVRGRVVDEAGQPVAGTALRIDYESAWTQTGGSQVWTDEEGGFTLPKVNFAAAGRYSVVVENREHYQPVRWPMRAGGGLVQIPLRTGKTLTGTVTNQKTGSPVPGVNVMATYADPMTYQNEAASPTPGFSWFEAEGATDARGRFHFSNLGDAPVRLQVQGMNPADANKPDVAVPGQTSPVFLYVRP